MIQGPWDDPLIFPDPESLIRRSPASAPLLDAVKDRKTRDAVRSVLERITGSESSARGDRSGYARPGPERRVQPDFATQAAFRNPKSLRNNVYSGAALSPCRPRASKPATPPRSAP